MKFAVATKRHERLTFLTNYVDVSASTDDNMSPSIQALKTLIVEFLTPDTVNNDSLHSRIHNALNAQRTGVALHIERKEELRNRYLHGSVEYAAADLEIAQLQRILDILNALSEGKMVPMS